MGQSASNPSGNGRQYHLHTRPGDLAPHCILVGAQGRASAAADAFLRDVTVVENPYRGLRSCTGWYHPPVEGDGIPEELRPEPLRISIVTHGMGPGSIGIVLEEVVKSGGRFLLRVGSCSAIPARAGVGGIAIVDGAVRYDGTSDTWASIPYPARPHHRLVGLLEDAATELGVPFITGLELTGDFGEGQGRPDERGFLLPAMQARRDEASHHGVACYSMEAATLFVYALTHWGGVIPTAAVNAVFGNRETNEFVTSEEGKAQVERDAMRVALQAAYKFPRNLVPTFSTDPA